MILLGLTSYFGYNAGYNSGYSDASKRYYSDGYHKGYWEGYRKGCIADYPPIPNIRDSKQLFFDDYIVESMENVKRVINQPVKYAGNPVLKPDEPWEKGLAYATGNIIHDEDEGIYKMWYQVVNYDWSESMMAYATSRDGIHWEKPALGLMEYNGTKENNIVFGLTPGFDGPGVFKDPVETDPSRRYKMLYRCPPPVCAAYSPDGIHWTPYVENPVIPTESDTHEVVFWDNKLQRYVAHLRLWLPYREDEPENYIRVVGRSESTDFIRWTPTVPIVKADEKDEPKDRNFYNMEVMQYEGIYIGFISVYHILPGMEGKPVPPDKPWMDKVDVQLTFSRDGRTWMRVGDRQVFLPTGSEGSFDWGMIFTLQSPLVVNDEIWIYYVGFSNLHWFLYRGEPQEGAIGLAKLRLDGFVSIDAESKGVLTTKPFIFDGNRLELNTDAEEGAIYVELLDPNNRPIPGFSKDDCDPVTKDEIHHTVSWNGKSDIGFLRGKTIKLKFYLNKAKLYSFRFYTAE